MILVTGGLGFIGSHIALSLLAQGQEIVIVDNLANSTLQTLERLEYISGMYKLTKTTKHAKRHFWLNDVCTCHGLLPSHSA